MNRKNVETKDIVSWTQKAEALISFWVEAHNATWDSDNALVRGGQVIGAAVLLTFTVECALKALLEKDGKEITGKLRTHNVHKLYEELEPQARAGASAVYSELVKAETDGRVQMPPTNALGNCLQNHARTFTDWRYDLSNAEDFYHVPMIYAAYSFLTFANPSRTYVVSSATSRVTEVTRGTAKRR